MLWFCLEYQVWDQLNTEVELGAGKLEAADGSGKLEADPGSGDLNPRNSESFLKTDICNTAALMLSAWRSRTPTREVCVGVEFLEYEGCGVDDRRCTALASAAAVGNGSMLWERGELLLLLSS